MDAKEFLEISSNECKKQTCHNGCKFFKKGGFECTASAYRQSNSPEYIDKAIAIAEEIKASRVTYLKKIKELLPNVRLNDEWYPPYCVGVYFGNNAKLRDSECNRTSCLACWNREYKEG